MTKVLVLYYSSYGHIKTMASAVADRAGATVAIRRVPELVPEAVAAKSGYKVDQSAPVATVAELKDYGAIIIGTPTRFSNMVSQMKNVLDQTGGHWFEDKLVGKMGSVFTSTGRQHGGQETTIISTQTVLFHLGMIIVGLPYSFKGQMRMDEITGCTTYGASTLADDGRGGHREVSENELEGACFQGRHLAENTSALVVGSLTRAS